MNCFKKTTCTLLAFWTPIVFAYSKFANSKGEVLSPPTQMKIVAAILLDENGENRCKIVSNEFLLSERFDEFVEQNPEAKEVLNDLRECDDGDEYYANFVLDPEEIQIGTAGASFGGYHRIIGSGLKGFSYVTIKTCSMFLPSQMCIRLFGFADSTN